jgi:hypothetical protein
LGELLAAPDLVAQAITQLEQRADDPEEYEDAAPALAELLYRRGLLDRLLAKAAEGDCFASMRAAGILVEQGRSDKAIRILRAQADRGGLWDENARKKAAEIEQQEIRRTS